MSIVSRRGLLGAAAATAVASVLPGLPAMAAAPFRNVLPPAWQRFKVGEFEATVVSDGLLPIGKPEPAFPTAPVGELRNLLASNFLPLDETPLEQNILILNTGRQLILFDTGMGESMGPASKMFGPTSGRMLQNMRAAGIEPEQIDLVVLTHAHCDHCWGLVDGAGNRVFPNAQVAISETDLKFWTDDANKKGPEFMVTFIDGAKKNLLAYRDRMIMVKDGQPVAPGVVAISTPGHTMGHHCYAVTSGNATMVNTGDLAHHPVLLLRRPMWEFAYDSDPKLSAQTRTRMLDRLATDKHQILSYHFPWPGLGRVVKEGEGFGWYATPTNVSVL
ncbi:MBL fold metallo-hydrolase [Dankookia rubra]|uniref:MBL fold metallo-hydrolase n=1 Tax=Dankookia rubra TaxID=1442381 RepID=A0A4R5QJ41_9PROT|nr:MBL fold metallo-hydrolase [Dankookia rubra]TDH62809.1 MBL fold metallo-hydrolase [Dankookia rubra]